MLVHFMKIYYSLWRFRENQFSEPAFYDYSLPIRFPNIVFRAKDLKEAARKVESINKKIEMTDGFDSNFSRAIK